MRIAIGICGKTSGRCSSIGCFRAFNNLDKNFAIYKEENIEAELFAFFSCNLCFEGREEKLEEIGKRLKDNNIERVHIGKCAINCKENRYQEIRDTFKKLDIEIIEGTH